MEEKTKEVPAQQGAIDLKVLVDNLDQRGLLVLQVMLGQRAIEILEAEKKSKVPFLKPTSLYIPG